MASFGNLIGAIGTASKNRIGDFADSIKNFGRGEGLIGGAANILKDQIFKELPYSQNVFNQVGSFVGDVASNLGSSGVPNDVSSMSEPTPTNNQVMVNGDNNDASVGYLKLISNQLSELFVELKTLTNITGKQFGVEYGILKANRQANTFMQNLDRRMADLAVQDDNQQNFVKQGSSPSVSSPEKTPENRTKDFFKALLGADAIKMGFSGLRAIVAGSIGTLAKSLLKGGLGIGKFALDIGPWAIGALVGYEGYQTFEKAYPEYLKDGDKEKFITTMITDTVKNSVSDISSAFKTMFDKMKEEIDSVDWAGLGGQIKQWGIALCLGLFNSVAAFAPEAQSFNTRMANNLKEMVGAPKEGILQGIQNWTDKQGANLRSAVTGVNDSLNKPSQDFQSKSMSDKLFGTSPDITPSTKNVDSARAMAQGLETKDQSNKSTPTATGNSFANVSNVNNSKTTNVLPQNMATRNPSGFDLGTTQVSP